MTMYDINLRREVMAYFRNYLEEELTGRNPIYKKDFSEEETDKSKRIRYSEIRLVPIRKNFEMHHSRKLITLSEYDVYIREKYKKSIILCSENGKLCITEVEKVKTKNHTGLVQKGNTIDLGNFKRNPREVYSNLERALVA